MPKINYIYKNFQTSSMKIINQANKIIDEYMGDGLKLTLRQLYYQFVARDLIANKQSEYKRLGSIINDARLSGYIDWEAIEDRTRNRKGNQHWRDPGQIIRAAAYGFMHDRWRNQDCRVEVWIEKEALVGVVDRICMELDVDYFACKGYVSQSEMWTGSQRFCDYNESDQDVVVLHLGDHDPSGIDMTRDIEERLHLFCGRTDRHFMPSIKRIALNMDQVDEFQPPPNPAKVTDSRLNGYVSKFGNESWELDALEPRILRELIKEEVEFYRDDELYQKAIEKEKEHLAILKHVEENWKNI